MTQTFKYPNLLTGSRSGAGWTYPNGGIDVIHRHVLYNNTNKENYIYSPLVSLKHGITYAFSAYSANTENCAGIDMFVLYEKIVDGWIAVTNTHCAKGPGGGGGYLYLLSPNRLSRGELPNSIRQQWLNRWKECDHLVRQPNAVYCFGAARMGSGRRGGVGVNDR